MRPGTIQIPGGTLETAWWGPSPAQAPTLVLLHEGLGSIALWRDVPEQLAASTGWGVFAYSRFGYGHSDTTLLPRPMTYMHHEATVVLPQVLRAAGIQQVTLVGHSDGGSIAAIYAGSEPAAGLQGLVTIAAHFFVEDLNIASIRQIRTEYETGTLRPRLARYHHDVEAAFKGWNDAWLDPRFRDFDITNLLPNIRVPILALQGAADPYGTDLQLHVLRSHVQVPISIQLIAGAQHAPHLEAKDAACAAITSFIANLPQGFPNVIEFQTDPTQYRHWKLNFDGPIATLTMDVDPAGGLMEGYELKLNSYDLGVDIELADAVQRLRFEHPEVKTVVLRSGKEGVFCAGANIRMLGRASHGHKVNFCKFTNETRLSIEDASENSGQTYLAAISGSAAGGGYELAVTADHIMLIDDRRSSVSLPELPLLAVLPGTGGLTRLTDKRRVRRDRADIFCTAEEGVRGKRAVEWRLVDEVVPPSTWEAKINERALELAAKSDRIGAKGIALTKLDRMISGTAITYKHVQVALDPAARSATITINGPATLPGDLRGIHDTGAAFWPLAMARELDDALLHLRLNHPSIGLLIFRSVGDAAQVLASDSLLEQYQTDWLVREIRLLLKRVFKRVDMMARSLITLIDPGSCFAGTLAELIFAADRAMMFTGTAAGDNQAPATLHLSALNFSAYPMGNGLSRLANRFYGEPDSLKTATGLIGETLDAETAEDHGLITFAYDETDWDDEIRQLLEERASFSPDALTGLEANLRFAGPETMETRIFGRLTAWQNWIFQRPNAVGEAGSLKRYGSGVRPDFNTERV